LSEVLASFKIKPVYLKEGSTRFGNWVLRKFQEEIYDVVNAGRDAVVSAVTGGGKTLSLFLGERGFVGLYPNNTLLLDQQKSVDRILRLALNAKLVYRKNIDGVDVLRVYELGGVKGELPITGYKKVAIVLLSGRYIGYEYDKEGNLIPKRVWILREIVDKICYGGDIYRIALGTPDTALMIMTGIYRNFEKAGAALHNAILASLEGESIEWVLSKYGVATVKEISDLSEMRICLLKYPWFIDEFHLYSDYEASLLFPALKVYREYVGWDYSIVFSSATPRGVLYERAKEMFKPRVITADIAYSGSREAYVRGETEVEVVAVPSHGRGLSKWINTGFSVPLVVEEKINEIKQVIESGGNTFIVVDRVNQVPKIVQVLNRYKIEPECSVSVKPPGCSDNIEPVVVGSESVSQGIDRENVKYGIISAYNVVSLIQRFGRIGRKTSSKVILVVPHVKRRLPLEELDGKIVSYNEFAEAVEETYSDILLSELGKCRNIEELYRKREMLVEASTIIGYAQASKPKSTFKELSHILRIEADLLDMFYGSPDIIAKTLMFRSSGFPVLVRKPDGKVEVADIGIVLRNYTVRNVAVMPWRTNDLVKKMLVLDIDFTPSRSYLEMELEPGNSRLRNQGLAEGLRGSITTIGELARFGYRLIINSENEIFTISSRELLEVPDIREQTLALVHLGDLLEFYTYTVRGVAVNSGSIYVFGLFI